MQPSSLPVYPQTKPVVIATVVQPSVSGGGLIGVHNHVQPVNAVPFYVESSAAPGTSVAPPVISGMSRSTVPAQYLPTAHQYPPLPSDTLCGCCYCMDEGDGKKAGHWELHPVLRLCNVCQDRDVFLDTRQMKWPTNAGNQPVHVNVGGCCGTVKVVTSPNQAVENQVHGVNLKQRRNISQACQQRSHNIPDSTSQQALLLVGSFHCGTLQHYVFTDEDQVPAEEDVCC